MDSTRSSRCTSMYDIRDFAANVGQGGDDQPALAAAISAAAPTGGTVVVPAGTYLLGAETQIPSNVTLLGAGDQTVLCAMPEPQGMVLLSCPPGSSGQTVQSLRLDGNKRFQNPALWGRYAGLWAADTSRLTISDCAFTNHPYACIICRASRASIESIRIVGNRFQDFGLVDGRKSATAVIIEGQGRARIAALIVEGNTFSGGRAGQLAGLAVRAADRVEIRTNRISDHVNVYEPGGSPAVKGVDLTDCSGVRIIDNEANLVVDEHWRVARQDSDSGVQYGFAFSANACRRLLIAGNAAYQVCAGFGVFDSRDFAIVGNRIIGDENGRTDIAAGCGLEINSNDEGVSGPAHGTVAGNTIRNLRTGIFVAYGREIVLSGNAVQTIQKTGLNLSQGRKTGLMIIRNVVRDVALLGNAAGGPYYGISLADTRMALVTGNTVTNDGPELPLHCLRVDRTCSRVHVRNNVLSGASGTPLENASTG